ncbi:hypothetical protein B0W47_16900 (plasmid) [Komagataeibacter nataicola]|uniref:Uncharacterized protein n=1 Tax=Komagataeibacter nataicola TaxID=265960 RepID=A0A9N7H2L5_9PROT|nr:hypothetical protein B0W47_16900 [Komagataeibacter nataicola]
MSSAGWLRARARVQPLQKQKAPHVVDDIGQADPHGGSGDTHGPDEQTRLRFLIGKDMLDAGSDHRLPCVGPLDMAGHGLETRLFPVDLRHEVLIGFRAIRGVGLNA